MPSSSPPLPPPSSRRGRSPSRSTPRAFDPPAARLDLNPALPEAVAGLARAQDLGGTPVPISARVAAADLDSYHNSQAYQQALSHYYPKRPVGNGKQFRGLAGAAVKALALLAKDRVEDRIRDDIAERIDAGELPAAITGAFDAAGKAASLAVVATGIK
ncbi:MAG: hypothetical protein WDN69_13120 [Aliidongia sp.]